MDEEKLASEITGCEDCHIQRQVMNWAFKQECSDCKYYNSGECTHPHYMYCEHCELWTPKWHDCKHYDRELGCCKLLSNWTEAMPILMPCVDIHCEHYITE